MTDVIATSASRVAFHDVSEATPIRDRILPPLVSLSGHSIHFTRSHFTKPEDMYSLVDRSRANFPARDSVIILPAKFVTSTPKH